MAALHRLHFVVSKKLVTGFKNLACGDSATNKMRINDSYVIPLRDCMDSPTSFSLNFALELLV